MLRRQSCGVWRTRRESDASAASGAYAALVPGRLVDTRPGLTTVDGVAAGTGVRRSGGTFELLDPARQTLLVLEAMKMETPIVSPYEAVVRAVHVAEGDRIAGGTLLVVGTYREAEVATGHPLADLLDEESSPALGVAGSLTARRAASAIELSPLSGSAVSAMARACLDLASQRRAWARAFRAEVTPRAVAELRRVLQTGSE